MYLGPLLFLEVNMPRYLIKTTETKITHYIIVAANEKDADYNTVIEANVQQKKMEDATLKIEIISTVDENYRIS